MDEYGIGYCNLYKKPCWEVYNIEGCREYFDTMGGNCEECEHHCEKEKDCLQHK